jgi:alpha,alpha-trehalase
VSLSAAQQRTSSLRDYAFIADGNRGALIGPTGDIAWMCFPGWSDPAVFAGLLDSGGVFRIAPEGRYVTGGYYEPDSLIWHSRWVTHQGIFESRDALVYPGAAERAVVLRRITAVDGGGDMIVEFAPASDYGRHPLSRWRRDGDVFVTRAGSLTVRLQVPPNVEVTRQSTGAHGIELHLKVVPGEQHDVVAEFVATPDLEDELPDAERCWRETEAAWRAAVPDCTGLIAAPDVSRSVAVLRAMTDSYGGTVAAATTSLPERDDADRNYDYRFCWVRDSCYVGQAGAALPGGEAILDDSVRWVAERLRADKDHTTPAYLGNGEPVFPPATLGLPGYPGGTDVVGNRVREQFQLDLFGESLLLFARAASLDRLDADGWRAAEIAIDVIEKRWDEPESGIWEIAPQRWTESRLICVAGLRAIASPNAPGNWSARALAMADHILDHTNQTSLHPSGRWQRAPDDERPDAALLLAEIRGALPASDARSMHTRTAIVDELGRDHYLYRYRGVDAALADDEGAFLLCSFWMSLAMLNAGEREESIRWFERARSAMSTAGLFTEEFDTAEHQLRGNLPQAFVHAMLIEAAVAQGDT